jgi:hypothetical protein
MYNDRLSRNGVMTLSLHFLTLSTELWLFVARNCSITDRNRLLIAAIASAPR